MRAMATGGGGAAKRDHTSDLQLLVNSAPSLIAQAKGTGERLRKSFGMIPLTVKS